LTETALIVAISAGSAGSVATVITTPVNVAKTRIMLSAAGDDAGADAMRKVKKARAKGQSVSSLASEKGVMRKSGLKVTREVLKESRARGLFRGGALGGIRTALGSGLYLYVYESGRHFLGNRHRSDSPRKM
jgi:solute carrier family 25 (mitochondrial S-adenosylmethionine transporter), member 26